MSMQAALPISVVLAGGLVAAALVLTRPPAPPATTAQAAAPAAEPPTPPPSVAPPVVPQETPEVRARGQDNAARALEAYRARFVEQCWAPAAARQPEPRRLPLTFNLSFSPDGALTGLGISEDRQVQRPEVGTCLRGIEVELKIPAPGVMLMVEVPFTLP
ncbi:MAG: hypothetical protein JNL82_06615 [Myxococcales bacterium]|nr:hypothetical protein [Myxococcales bacterium]